MKCNQTNFGSDDEYEMYMVARVLRAWRACKPMGVGRDAIVCAVGGNSRRAVEILEVAYEHGEADHRQVDEHFLHALACMDGNVRAVILRAISEAEADGENRSAHREENDKVFKKLKGDADDKEYGRVGQ